MLKKTYITISLLLCSFMLAFSVCRVAAASTALAVDPPTSTVNVGDSFTVNVNVTNVVNLTAWELKLYYKNTMLNCTNAVEGPFLQAGGSTFFNKTFSSNYVLAYATIFGAFGVTGSGVLVTFTFKALSAGITNLTLNDTKLVDEKMPPQPIPHVDYNGTVTVVGAAHDVAVTNLASYKTIIGGGLASNVSATIANLGGYAETFNVTVYANTTVITRIVNVNLASGGSNVQTVVWDTTGFAYGNYTLKASADVVSGETNTANNNCTGGWVRVSIVGDITGGTPNLLDFVPDGQVNMKDVGTVARFFSQDVPPAPPECDVTGITTGLPDGTINMRDVGLVARHFGEHNP